MSKNIAIIFLFYPSDETYAENLRFFLESGYHAGLDVYVAAPGEYRSQVGDLGSVSFIEVLNINLDYGALCQVVQKTDLSSYDFVFVINSTCRGPFVPPWYEGDWTSIFSSRLNGEEGAVGASINHLSSKSRHFTRYEEMFGSVSSPLLSHIQTYAYCLSRGAFLDLLQSGFFNFDREMSKDEIICRYELGLSQFLRIHGYRVLSLDAKLDKFMLEGQVNPPKTSRNGDTESTGSYFGRTPHPYERIFLKSNRGMFSEQELDLIARRDWSSFFI